ncbi:MAG: hypothetical protein RMI34_01280 [Chloroherpetonaceae bacterium]|nr:hypothetical protein [Chloroherpetonaceae bacterium]MCS7211359.1 hypothetical protein [Chloroherpetonaceae bacterium]MDW8018690.1 hypothetical protein [Chloroherpetonaceae bacterium]
MHAIVEGIKVARQERARKAIERAEFVKQMQTETARLRKTFAHQQEQVRKENAARKQQVETMLAQHQAELKAAVKQLSQRHQQLRERCRAEHKTLQLMIKQQAVALRTNLKTAEQTRLQQQQVLMNRIHDVICSKQEEVKRIQQEVTKLRQRAREVVQAFAQEHKQNQAIWAELSQQKALSVPKSTKVATTKAMNELSELEKQFAINIPFAKPKK